jgi:nitroreductase
MDSGLGRLSICGGGSVFPFCHNVLLAARDLGYGGCITTVLVRQEPAVKALLGIPDEHAIAATVVLGRPSVELTKLRREPVASFATYDRFDGPPLG